MTHVVAAILAALDDDTLGQRQNDTEVDLAAVEHVGLEGDAVLHLGEVGQQIRLVHQQPAEQRQKHAVGVPGEVGEDHLKVIGVFEGQALGRGAADPAIVDEYHQAVAVVPEFRHGGEQMCLQAIGLVHGGPLGCG